MSRPANSLTLREAEEATGRSTRHLRRLLAEGKVEGVVGDDGRRYVSTASLLQAGLSLQRPAGDSPPAPDMAGREVTVLQEEVTRLRARLEEAERRARRAEEGEAWARLTIDRILTALPAGTPDTSGGSVTLASPADTPLGRRRRWGRRREAVPTPG